MAFYLVFSGSRNLFVSVIDDQTRRVMEEMLHPIGVAHTLLLLFAAAASVGVPAV